MTTPNQARVTPTKACTRERRNFARMGAYLKGGGLYKEEGSAETINLVTTAIDLTTTYNIDVTTDRGIMIVNPSTGPYTINLPVATTVAEGHILYFKNTSGTDNFTLDVASSGNIDGTSGGTDIGAQSSCAVIAATVVGGTREWFFLEEP